MNGRRETGRRRLLAFGVCLVALLGGGCVYLRLLALKHQLADFDRNFELHLQDGLRLVCRKPVLLTGDLRWLGIVPETITRRKNSEEWHVHWVKEPSDNTSEPEPAAHDIELQLNFADNKFTGFSIAERYFAFIPKIFVTGLLRGLGTASINREKRAISANIAPSPSHPTSGRPTLASLTALLGSATDGRTEGAFTLRHYRYLPPTPGSNNGDFDLLFTFDTATGVLVQLDGRSPVGNILLNFGAPVAAGASALKAPFSASP